MDEGETDVSWSYRFVILFFTAVRKIFFRDLIVRGSYKIPRTGPVIFVAAPHANQFVDPVILASTSRRAIGFLIAKVSLKRRIIGFLGRAMGAIPVDRVQDHAKRCTGSVRLSEDGGLVTIVGEGTRFAAELQALADFPAKETVLFLSYEKEQYTAPILEVIDETRLVLKRPFESRLSAVLAQRSLPFSVAPHIDQNQMFTSVFKALGMGKCIGIFPEGGSHDRAEMLPLKAGVAIMALGFETLQDSPPLSIVPCGLNYFHADKFRSRAVIEYGDPFHAPPAMVEMFKAGGDSKKAAISGLLGMITQNLHAVTVNVPDIDTLQVIQAARRLYRPPETLSKPDLQVELTRRFIRGYMMHREDPRVVQLKQSILDYNGLLSAFGLKDHMVMNTDIAASRAVMRLWYHAAILLVFGLVSLPGFLINGPALYIISRISRRKAVAAKKASSVKIHGKDVVSTWKVLVALVLLPCLYSTYSLVGILCFCSGKFLLAKLGHFVYLYSVVMLISYITVRLSELVYDSYHSLLPLFMALLNPHRYSILQQVRRSLRDQINFIVNELGPSVVEDFERNRIVKSNDDLFRSASPVSPLYQQFLSSVSSSLSGSNSGRASPVFDMNMEAIENMLEFCKQSVKEKKKIE